MAGGQTRIDVATIIDRAAIGAFQIRIFAICFVVMMCDGFDTQAVAYVAPSLAVQWKLAPASFGPVFSAALLGSLFGAFLFGFVADRYGRKRTLAACVALFGVMNLACAYADSVATFTLMRFVAGFGLGGAIPNVMALVSEYAPRDRRATTVAVTWCGFAVGAVAGGIVSVPLVTTLGWTSVFVAGGLLPIALLPVLLAALPESIKYLTVSNQGSDAIRAVLARVSPGFLAPSDATYLLGEDKPEKAGVAALFRNGLAPGSIFLCLAFFMSLLLVYCFINWIPLLLREAGLPLQDALTGTIVFNLAGILGSLVCTKLIDRYVQRTIAILAIAYALGTAATIAIGFVGLGFWPIMTAIFLCGFFNIGVQLSLNAAITNYYPTAIRGTGVGWSLLVGRTGSLIGPLVGGLLVASGMSPNRLFEVSGAAPFLACLSLGAFTLLSRGKRPAPAAAVALDTTA